MADEQPRNYQIKLTLEKFAVLDDRDPGWLGPGEIHFTCHVTAGADQRRVQVTRLPSVGVFKMHPGEQILERVIFEGPVHSGESLEIRVTGVEEDFLGSPDQFERYSRRFRGDPLSWNGSYQPGDEAADPEARADWQLWYRIEVKPAEEIYRPPRQWAQELANERLMDARRDLQGNFDPDIWQKALAHRRKMRAEHPYDEDPGGLAPENDVRAVCYLSDGKQIPVEATESPHPFAGFGEVDRFVIVTGEDRLDDEAVLKLGVSVQELDGINPATLRLFRWDERRNVFRVVMRSGLGRNGTYVWGRINRSGIYGVFGLPGDRARLTTSHLMFQLSAWHDALAGIGGDLGVFNPKICQLILCADQFRTLLDDPEALAKFGLQDEIDIDLAQYGEPPYDEKGRPIGPRPRIRPGPGRFTGNICEQCLGVVGLDGIGGWDSTPDGQLFPACEQWISLGPTNLGARVKVLAFHPTNSSIVFAGNSQGGVFKSTDGGAHWRPLMSGELSIAIGALAVAPGNGDIIYAGTGEYDRWYPPGVGIYKSTDGGNDWDLTEGATANNRFSRILVHPTNPMIVYAAGNAGVERTTDGGRVWNLILPGSVSDIAMDPNDPAILYAGREDGQGIQSTPNAEATPVIWTPMNAGLTLMVNHTSFPANNFIKLAATSDNAGSTVLWLQINSLPDPWAPPAGDPNPARGPDWGEYQTTLYRWDGMSWNNRGTLSGTTYFTWCSTIAVEPGNPDVVYAGNLLFFWTPDAGTNWYQLGAGHADNHTIAVDPSNQRRTLIGNDGGLFQHTRAVNADGTPAETGWNYSAANDGLVSIQFENVAVSENGIFGIAGSTQDQGILVNHVGGGFDGLGGAEWGPVDVFAGNGNIIMWDPHFSVGPPLQRTEDGGLTRRDADNGLGGRFVTEIAIHPTNANLVLVAAPAQQIGNANQPAAIFRSTDGGAPAPATGFASVQQFVAARVNDIAFSPSDPTRAYAVLSNGQIWFSTDTGASWRQLGNGPLAGVWISSITVDWTDPNLIYITYQNVGIRHAWVGEVQIAPAPAVTWRDISGRRLYASLPDVPAHRLIVDQRFSETLYIATDIGVFRTVDGGDWWYPFDEGLPNAIVTDMAYRPAGHRLYVSTFGRGMYSRNV